MRRLLALCLLAPALCASHPYTVDDLLRQESYGQVFVAPTANLVLVERRRRYDTADDYSYGYLVRRLLSKIEATSLSRPGRLMPLFDQDDGAGYWMGSVSPGGRRLTVFRLKNRHLSVGVVELGTRRVFWLGVSPDLPIASPAPIWIDDDHLALVAIPDRTLPFILSLGNALQTDLSSLWHQAARGSEPSSTLVSGKEAVPDRSMRSLVEIDLGTNTARTLAVDAITDVALSPDRRTLAVVAADAFRQPPSRPIGTWFIGRHHHLLLIDRTTGSRIAVRGDYLPGFLRWSPDGGALLVYKAVGDFEHGRFLRIARDGATRTLAPAVSASIAHQQSGTIVQAGWAGSLIAALVMTEDARTWQRIDRSPIPLQIPDDAELVGATGSYLWFLATGRLLRLDASGHAKVMASNVTGTGVTSLDPFSTGYRHALGSEGAFPAMNGSGGRSMVTLLPTGIHVGDRLPREANVVAVAPGAAVTTEDDDHGITTLRLLRGRESTVIDTINRENCDIETGRAIPLYRSSPAGMVTDWLFLPNGTAKAPMVVIPYPGATFAADRAPFADATSWPVPTNAPLLLARGYAVLMPSLPPASDASPATGIVAAADAAVDAAIATGRVDRDRLGVLGHSFGAYAAMILATRSPRYRAIVASSGPYDLAGAHGMMTGAERIRLTRGLPFDNSAGWAEAGQARMEAAPGAAAGAYVANSPIFDAAKVRSAVMLVHGDTDTVAIEQAERMFMELARSGGDASLLRYWGEGHVLASPANIRDYWGRVIAFFDTHLTVSRSTPAATPRSSPSSPTLDSRD